MFNLQCLHALVTVHGPIYPNRTRPNGCIIIHGAFRSNLFRPIPSSGSPKLHNTNSPIPYRQIPFHPMDEMRFDKMRLGVMESDKMGLGEMGGTMICLCRIRFLMVTKYTNSFHRNQSWVKSHWSGIESSIGKKTFWEVHSLLWFKVSSKNTVLSHLAYIMLGSAI